MWQGTDVAAFGPTVYTVEVKMSLQFRLSSHLFFANEELTFKMSLTSLSKRVFLTLIILSLDLPSLTLSYCFTNIHDDPQRVPSKRI